MKILAIIPARGGSKGIPQKNIKLMAGKPLLGYAIEAAREVLPDASICLSTDDARIMQVAQDYALPVPFERPAALASDTATSQDVLMHALDFYAGKGEVFDTILLLQPTSPFRTSQHIKEALAAYTPDLDMLVSVKETEANPYYLLVEEDEAGFLQKSKKTAQPITRRQDIPKVYQYNGAIYVINVAAFRACKGDMSLFKKVKKYEMDALASIDIDTPLDWDYAEFLIEKGYIKI